MSGVTAIYNDKAPGSKQVSLFFNTNAGNLALEQRHSNKTPDEQEDNTYVAGAGDQPGYILTGSQVATANLEGVTLVFAITKQYTKALKGAKEDCSCDDPTYSDLSIVSPIYKTLNTTDYGQYSVAACASEDSIFVFYLTGASGNASVLKEEVLGEDSSKDWPRAEGIVTGSSLAAYWDPEKNIRACIYQRDGQLWEIQSDAVTTNAQIQYPQVDAKNPTPLSVVYVPDKKEVHLYYRTYQKSLQKVIKSKGQWSNIIDVSAADGHLVNDDSQLGVVAAGGYNHVFYKMKAGKGKFEHVRDPL